MRKKDITNRMEKGIIAASFASSLLLVVSGCSGGNVSEQAAQSKPKDYQKEEHEDINDPDIPEQPIDDGYWHDDPVEEQTMPHEVAFVGSEENTPTHQKSLPYEVVVVMPEKDFNPAVAWDLLLEGMEEYFRQMEKIVEDLGGYSITEEDEMHMHEVGEEIDKYPYKISLCGYGPYNNFYSENQGYYMEIAVSCPGDVVKHYEIDGEVCDSEFSYKYGCVKLYEITGGPDSDPNKIYDQVDLDRCRTYDGWASSVRTIDQIRAELTGIAY